MSTSRIGELVEVISLILELEKVRKKIRRQKKVETEDIRNFFLFARSIKATIEGIDRIPPVEACSYDEIQEVTRMLNAWLNEIKLPLLAKLFT
jgi:hypothetical protein